MISCGFYFYTFMILTEWVEDLVVGELCIKQMQNKTKQKNKQNAQG